MSEHCPFCGAETILSDRRYDLPGFPYPHECEDTLTVPGESDFCPSCSTLTWGKSCVECKPAPARKQRLRPRPVEAEELPL